jgi:hypothetical protein
MHPLELKEVKSVETQVVAGVNYRLTLSIGTPSGHPHDVTTVVHVGFDNVKQLTQHN